MTWQRGVLCFPFRNRYTTSTQKMLFPLPWCILALVYPVQPDLCMSLYRTGGWARIKNQIGIGGARTPLPSGKTEEKWVGGKNQEWQNAQCSSCSVDHRDWGWALLSLPPEDRRVAKSWTQASLGCCTCRQVSHRGQPTPSILPGPNDFAEARSV